MHWVNIPIESVVGRKKAILVKSLITFYLSETGRNFNKHRHVDWVISNPTEHKKLASFCIGQTQKIKDKKLLLHSLLSLSEIYNATGLHRSSIIFCKASYNFASSVSQKKNIRERLVSSTQGLILNLIAGGAIKKAANVIADHIIFIVSTHKNYFSKSDCDGIRSLIVSPQLGKLVLSKINNTPKKRKNLVMQSIVKKIEKIVMNSC